MPVRLRASTVLVCLAIAVLVTLDATAAVVWPVALTIAVWLYAPAATITVAPRDTVHCSEQTSALLRVRLSRGPPLLA